LAGESQSQRDGVFGGVLALGLERSLPRDEVTGASAKIVNPASS
jgi:hypothetical protein